MQTILLEKKDGAWDTVKGGWIRLQRNPLAWDTIIGYQVEHAKNFLEKMAPGIP